MDKTEERAVWLKHNGFNCCQSVIKALTEENENCSFEIVRLFPIYSQHKSPRPTIITELSELYALPCTHIQLAIRDRYRKAYACQHTLCMRRHVV